MPNDGCRREVLEKLYDAGPLPRSELPDTTEVPWRSSGWNNDRSLRMLLDRLTVRGEIAVAGYEGREKLWDLAERVYPDDPPVPLEKARRIRGERRLHALGLARQKAAEAPSEPNDVGEVGEPAVIEGVRGKWRVDPAYLDGVVEPRAALLSPLDRLVFDRKRMTEIFEFDYQLEMYKPVAERRWGSGGQHGPRGRRLDSAAAGSRGRGDRVDGGLAGARAHSLSERSLDRRLPRPPLSLPGARSPSR